MLLKANSKDHLIDCVITTLNLISCILAKHNLFYLDGVVGISVTGIQYLTAGGNEEQTRKSKRRMFEIIIGLAVYATFFMLMQWLINDFEIKKGSYDSNEAALQEHQEIYLWNAFSLSITLVHRAILK